LRHWKPHGPWSIGRGRAGLEWLEGDSRADKHLLGKQVVDQQPLDWRRLLAPLYLGGALLGLGHKPLGLDLVRQWVVGDVVEERRTDLH
jgi:hypothetical protein